MITLEVAKIDIVIEEDNPTCLDCQVYNSFQECRWIKGSRIDPGVIHWCKRTSERLQEFVINPNIRELTETVEWKHIGILNVIVNTQQTLVTEIIAI